MTGFKFDSKQVNSFDAIPAGRYECLIESGAIKTSGNGNPFINFKLKIRDDVEGQSFGGRVVFYVLTLSPNTQGIVHGFLGAIGTPEDKVFQNEFPSKELAEEIKTYAVGRAVVADVKIEPYQGKDTNKVGYCVASSIGGGVVEDPFAPGAGPIEISDDDLPF